MTQSMKAAAPAVGETFEHIPDETSRRMLLTLGGAAALALFSSKADAQAQIEAVNPPGHEVEVTWNNPLNRLVRRLTYSIDPYEQAQAANLGFKGYLEKQLNYGLIDDQEADHVVLGRWPKMYWNEAHLYDDNDQYDQYLQLQFSTYFRAVFSRKMLFERMVEFWTDHFNVQVDKVGTPLMTSFIQKNIRRNALGKFPDLLKSTAHSAAMLDYLDNDDNSADAPNINYSRELHELHTVGADGGYTGKDLRQAALVLSGWTWSWNGNSPNRGRFRFEEDDHAGGTKTVMGQTYTEDGVNEGEKLLDYLSLHPNTARFITLKLIKWFLGEPVNNTVWTAAQNTFLSSKGDIKAVLRVILTQPNLMASNAKYKRPQHLLWSAFKGCKSRTYQYDSILYSLLNEAGHIPFDWATPDGYPDRFEYWGPSQLARLNFAFRVAGDDINGVVTDVNTRFGNDRTPQGCLNTIAKTLFGGEMSATDRSALLAYLTAATIDDERLKGAIALALACPSFQWY